MSGQLLHPEALRRLPVVGSCYEKLLSDRVGEVGGESFIQTDPDVTVLIRTRNHADRIADLLTDITEMQNYSGQVQIVATDTESTDGTVDILKAYGATVRNIEQDSFNYADSLNVGFEAADNPYVFTFVGHSRLSNNQTFRGLTRWIGLHDFGGAYGAALPDNNATLGDVAISLLQHNSRRLTPSQVLTEWVPGTMVAHRSVVAKDAWRELGGYDRAYGNGGEDGDFGRRLLASGGSVVREPVLSVHHSYGLNWHDTIRQIRKLRALRSGQKSSFVPTDVRHLKTAA